MNLKLTNIDYMKIALQEATKAEKNQEVPVGAIIIDNFSGEVIAKGYNQVIKGGLPTLHAEIIALTQAARKTNNYRLTNMTLYTTLEPCPMCAGALIHSRMYSVIFGAYDPKGGAIANNAQLFNKKYSYNHKPLWQGGVLEKECSQILTSFFKKIRTDK